MEFSRKEEKMIKDVCEAIEVEVLELPEIQLAMIGGGVADVTLS